MPRDLAKRAAQGLVFPSQSTSWKLTEAGYGCKAKLATVRSFLFPFPLIPKLLFPEIYIPLMLLQCTYLILHRWAKSQKDPGRCQMAIAPQTIGENVLEGALINYLVSQART